MLESSDRPGKIVTIGQTDTIKQAAATMLSHNVGCLIVNDDEGRFIGLITERDIAHHIAESSESIGETHVTSIMTDNVVSWAPAQRPVKSEG